MQSPNALSARTSINAADLNDTRFGKIGEGSDGAFTTALSYTSASGWQGDSFGLKTFLGNFITRFDVSSDTTRFQLVSATPLPKIGDLVRQGTSDPYIYYTVVNTSSLSSDLGYNLITVIPDTPAAPTNLSTSGVTSRGAILAWSYAATSVVPSYYSIDVKIEGGSWIFAASASYGFLSSEITNLQPESNYSIRIKAVTSDNKVSAYATTTVTTTQFDITSLSGIISWFRADQGVRTTSSNLVSSWTDLSVNQKNATQSALTAMPVLSTSYIWGPAVPGVNFSATTAKLAGSPLLPFNEGFGRQGPVFSVTNFTAQFSSGDFLFVSVSPSHVNRLTGPWSGSISIDSTAGSLDNPSISFTPPLVLNGWRDRPVTTGREPIMFQRTTYFTNTTAVDNPLSGTNSTVYFLNKKDNKKSAFIKRTVFRGSNVNAPNNWWNSWTIPEYNFSTQDNTLLIHEAATGKDVLPISEVNLVSDLLFNRWMRPNLRDFVLFLGDSLTYGYAQPEPDSYPYKCALSAEFIADYFNAGISGRTCAQVLSEVATYSSFVRPNKRNIAVVYLGVNNLNNAGATATYASLSGIVTSLKSYEYSQVYLLTCIPYVGDNSERINYNALMRVNVANADGIIDIANLPEFVSGSAYNDTTYYQDDKLHLTAAGNQVISNAVNAVLLPILNQ